MDDEFNAKEPILGSYLVEAMVRYINDIGKTPHLTCLIDKVDPSLSPYGKDGCITFNVSSASTAGTFSKVDNNYFYFKARFNSIPTEVFVPIEAVLVCHCKENTSIGIQPSVRSVNRDQENPPKEITKAVDPPEKKKEGNVTIVDFNRNK